MGDNDKANNITLLASPTPRQQIPSLVTGDYVVGSNETTNLHRRGNVSPMLSLKGVAGVGIRHTYPTRWRTAALPRLSESDARGSDLQQSIGTIEAEAAFGPAAAVPVLPQPMAPPSEWGLPDGGMAGAPITAEAHDVLSGGSSFMEDGLLALGEGMQFVHLSQATPHSVPTPERLAHSQED